MGTKVHSKGYLPGYYSMRDLNEDCSSSSWPLCYGVKATPNGQYYNGFTPRAIMDGSPEYGKDALKQKMLEHEAVFKNQVYELHRLYRIQRDLMEEVKRKEVNGIRASMEPSSSSSLRGSQVPSEDARKWHMAGFPLYERTSISGVEVINSPMSCTKGNNITHPGQFPFQNGSSLKDPELLDTRPLKVRKKLFDLELPADEYADTEDDKKLPECKASDVSSCAAIGNLKSVNDCRVAESACASLLRNPIGLADLNEPIEIEEAIAPSSTEFFCHSSINGETKGVNSPAKSNASYFGVNEERTHPRDVFFINPSVESKVNEREQLSHLYGAGSSKSNFGLQQDKLPIASHNPVRGMLRRDHFPGIYPTGCSKDILRDKNHHGLESSDRGRNHSINGRLEPHLASEAARKDPFLSSAFSGSWAYPVPPMAKTALESRYGFYHGSSSGQNGLKVHLRPGRGDYLNRSLGENVASDSTTNHGFGRFPNGSYLAGSKPAMDINLNEVVPKSLSNEAVILQDVTTVDEKGKPEDRLSALPWLKNKPAYAASNHFSCKAEAVTDLNQPFTPENDTLASSKRKMDISESQNVKKILGFPIFGTGALTNESASYVSTSASFSHPPEGIKVNEERKNIVIDINLECEPEEQIAAEEETVDEEKQAKCGSVRDFIDLNSCVSDCEDALASSYESKTGNVKTVSDIDLESPVPVENEYADAPTEENIVDAKIKSPQDEVLKSAAETILTLSSSRPEIHADASASDSLEASLAESLLLFVDAVSLFSGSNNGLPKDFSGEMDDFEVMTLRLPEMKEEDYMPTPFVPELPKAAEDVEASLPSRPRRGQSRRGRQRKDFQRDILPSLSTLSRHEVTEDIQTFSGLMRATGHHHWISGLTRRNGTRNGAGRGRRRAAVVKTPSPVCSPLMQQLNSIEGGLEDRSLTGWGKTTRRPRRQRCPAGNPPAVVIT